MQSRKKCVVITFLVWLVHDKKGDTRIGVFSNISVALLSFRGVRIGTDARNAGEVKDHTFD
jgi:hypothetical protein